MKNKKLLFAAIAVVVVIGLMVGVWFATRPQVQEGTKSFTLVIVHGNGEDKTLEFKTAEEMLGAFLESQGVIDAAGADAGMFSTVDGEKADWEESRSYWAFYIGDAYATTGIYDTPIVDGEVYKLVYTFA